MSAPRMLCVILLGVLTAVPPALAEPVRMTVARGFGLGFLQMMMLEDRKMIEQHARAAGIDVTVDWITLRSSDAMFDGLLSGTVHIASLGVPGLATIWEKTKGSPQEVKGLSGFNVVPWSLNTREPDVKTFRDLVNAKGKIAVPGVKVSIQARMLQMAAIKEWGKENYDRLDAKTVSMTNPDGAAAMVTASTEITTHFTGPPFVERELKVPGIRRLTTSTEIVGGDVSFIVLGMPTKFYRENPKLAAAFVDALQEATDIVNGDKKAAANEYIRISRDTTDPAEVLDILSNGATFTLDPVGTLPFFHFMHDIKLMKTHVRDWKDYMHPIAHARRGS